MPDITKGTLLSNRYELVSQTEDGTSVTRWIARDDKLGRDVALTVFRTDFVHADAALDSARRVAGLEDHRIVRVLDVGSDGDYSYIVEEPHLGAHSVADLARFEQLHPEEARRITGEVAAALEAARMRGLHHLVLDPRKVLRLADGSIVLGQLAVGASLTGEDDISSAEATTIDTHGVINLLYFALTRTWAGDPIDDPKLPPAERRADGQYPTPHEVLENVPGDLDTLCRQALNYSQPPRTPGEVAKLVSPWSSQMITAPGRPRRTAGAASDDTDSFTLRKADPDAWGAKRPGVGAVGAAAMASAATSGSTGSDVNRGTGASSAGSTTTGGSSKSVATDASAPKTASTPKTASVKTSDSRGGSGAVTAGAAAAGAGVAGAGAAAASGTQIDPADATMVGRPVSFDADETAMFTLSDEDRAYTRTTYDPSFEELEPPVPGLQTGTDDPDASSSKLALAIVAGFVVLALALAVLGLGNITSKPAASKNTQTAAAPDKPATSSSSSASSSSSSSSAAGTPVQLSQARIVQDNGTRVAESAYVAQAIDGDPTSAWKSLYYLNQPWGGYPNRGGLAVTLPGETKVKSIVINPGEFPLTADVYVGDQPGTSGTKVGSVSAATSEQTVDAKGAEGKYVTIYVTDMAETKGRYRASVAELTVNK